MNPQEKSTVSRLVMKEHIALDGMTVSDARKHAERMAGVPSIEAYQETLQAILQECRDDQ